VGAARRASPTRRDLLTRSARAGAAVALAALGAGALVACSGGGAGAERRNVIVVVTDDQPRRTLRGMPAVQAELVRKGVTFTNAIVSNPVCCPSRATLLTGLYSNRTGVWANGGKHGGWRAFRRWETRTVATWLDDAGYETAFLGKYLNEYDEYAPTHVPPGWDRWYALGPADHVRFYDYGLNVDGTLEHRGDAPEDYSTDVLAAEAERFVRAAESPFLLVVAPVAPHVPYTPAPRHADAAASFVPGPAYNRVNRGHPAWLRARDRVDARHVAKGQVRSLLAVDELIAALVAALEDEGELDETAIILTSDNGYSWGDHRWIGKLSPHEESIGVPLVVRADGVAAPGRRSELVGNVDLAPTIAALAGVTPPDGLSGRSLVTLLAGPRPSWRRTLTLEAVRHPGMPVPSYCGIRRPGWTYVRYSTGEEELYDLGADPSQLRNLAPKADHAKVLAALREVARRRCGPLAPRPDGRQLQ
jgi:arylsulfatase A-like enzyme